MPTANIKLSKFKIFAEKSKLQSPLGNPDVISPLIPKSREGVDGTRLVGTSKSIARPQFLLRALYIRVRVFADKNCTSARASLRDAFRTIQMFINFFRAALSSVYS